MYCVSCLIFVKHKRSSGDTQQQASSAYVHKETCFMFPRLPEKRLPPETTASVYKLYEDRPPSRSDVVYFGWKKKCHFYILFVVLCDRRHNVTMHLFSAHLIQILQKSCSFCSAALTVTNENIQVIRAHRFKPSTQSLFSLTLIFCRDIFFINYFRRGCSLQHVTLYRH